MFSSLFSFPSTASCNSFLNFHIILQIYWSNNGVLERLLSLVEYSTPTNFEWRTATVVIPATQTVQTRVGSLLYTAIIFFFGIFSPNFSLNILLCCCLFRFPFSDFVMLVMLTQWQSIILLLSHQVYTKTGNKLKYCKLIMQFTRSNSNNDDSQHRYRFYYNCHNNIDFVSRYNPFKF